MTEPTTASAPPAAEGLPPGVLDSATDGASALDASARTPYGQNLLAHALVQMARDGWLRPEPGDGFETVQDRETPEPQDAPAVSAVPAPAADQTAPVCKFDEGCHRVVACDPGCGAPLAVTDQAALRDRIAEAVRDAACNGDCGKTEEECAKERIQPVVWHHGRLAVIEGTPEQIAAAVLPVLPTPADRAAEEAYRLALSTALRLGTGANWEAIRDRAEDLVAEVEELTAAKRRLLDQRRPDTDQTAESAPADTEHETQAEDPARIDRIRPEFTEHASVESIDAQLQRARAQERRWHLRVEWLISLRQARVTQKARGEWPAAAQQPICKCPAEICQCGHHKAQQPKEARPPTGYGDGKGRVFCLPCARSVGADVPLTINDVDHWDLCPSCGRHVIDVARSIEEPQS